MAYLAEILLEAQPTPYWRMLRQIGVDHAVGVLPRGLHDWRGDAADLPWDLVPLSVYKANIEAEGFSLEVIEDNPPMDRLRLGKPGREEELEHFETLIRNLGRLGIPCLCYNWAAALGWLRTDLAVRGRAGALVAGYDHRRLQDAPPPRTGTATEEALWDNLRFFLERIIPVAEEAGVTLAMHPDDPPLSPIRGVPRIMRSVDAFQRLLELHPSPANAITFCQGNFALMTDDLPAAITQFGQQGRIAFVHFRDVAGTPEQFVETFHDEGPTDMFACIRAYRSAGFEGPLRTDHNPTLEGDRADVPGYSPLGRLHAIGYTQGLLEADRHARQQKPVTGAP
ncbi:MAG TPA: mannonate dehydratase [Gaiellaceae bacterium]|nr:mannonate dehydratase [Gaiellaceae bacterium]